MISARRMTPVDTQVITNRHREGVKSPNGRRDIGRRVGTAAQLSLLVFSLAMAAAGQDNASITPAQLRGVGIDQRLNNQVPLDLKFRDETGQTVTLGSYFGKKPVILSLVYYSCPMLCTLTQHGLVSALLDVQFDLGEQYQVVTVSIDPKESPELALGQKAAYLGLYGRPGAKQGWHFLVGDEPSIHSLAQAVGFHYKYMPEIDQFAHPTGIMVLTPQGKVSRYFYGIQYPPQDVRLALVEASNEKIGNPADMELMLQKGYSAGGSSPAESEPGKTPRPAAPSANPQAAPISGSAEGKR
ncbi:MAG TPA: SCO family protein [Terriglobia bacterium]|nr:SCO family protein [Terriglobia bacterium]